MSATVHGFVDADGRLLAADLPLAGLHMRAGGRSGGMLAVPQLALLARLVRRLGIVVSRGVVAADGDQDLDLWVRAAPEGDGVHLAIIGWSERARRAASPAQESLRDHDLRRAATDWQWETDDALRLTAISDGAPATGGLIGQPLTRLFGFVTGAGATLPIVEALAERRGFEDQFADVRGVARTMRVRLSGVPLIGGDGRFAGFRGTAVAHDAEATAAAPDGTANGDKPEADAFADRLSEALRAPLDRIIARAETIRLQGEGPIRRDYADYARDIAVAGRHLLGMVGDLLDLSAIERPDFRPEAEPIDLAEVAMRAAGLLTLRASAGGVRVDRQMAEAPIAAVGDFRRTLQILVNLIGNALRYSPEGGMVWLRGEQAGGRARITVADQGKGVAAEDQARIFEKFERVDTAEPGGTGLGLYIARRLARAMGGDVTVASAPGQGARFTLELPAGELPAGQSPAGQSPAGQSSADQSPVGKPPAG